MKLVYEYIHLSNNGVIKEQDINITGKYNFSFNKNLDNPIIVITDKTKYIENFFDKENIIVDITAIVGENGSGKTTIMDHISSKYYNDFNIDNWIQREKKIRIKIFERSIEGNLEYIVVHNLDLLDKKIEFDYSRINTFPNVIVPESKETSIVYITSNLTVNTRNSYNNTEIVYCTPTNTEESLESKIYRWFRIDNNTYIEALKEEFTKKDSKQTFQNTYENIKFINILIDTNCDLFDLEISKIEIYFSYLFLIFDETMKSNITKLISENFQFLYPNFKNPRDENLLREADQTLTSNLLTEIFIVFENHRNEILNSVATKNRNQNSLLIIAQLEVFLNSVTDEYKKYVSFYLHACNDLKDFLKILKDEKEKKTEGDYVFHIELKLRSALTKLLIEKWYKNEWSIIFRYLRINIHQLSGGENSLKYLYTTLYEAIKLNPLHTNILILLDEVDIYLHPLWERKFLSNLIDNLKILSKIKNNKFQIIYTTHSPITLSDMPISNVIFMKNLKVYNDASINTFSSNIFNLYKESFFLGDSNNNIATIGLFAQNKINDILSRINNKYNDCKNKIEAIENDKKTINMIGETIIRNTLNRYIKQIEEEDKFD